MFGICEKPLAGEVIGPSDKAIAIGHDMLIKLSSKYLCLCT